MATIPAEGSTMPAKLPTVLRGAGRTASGDRAPQRRRRRLSSTGGSRLARRGNTTIAWLFITPAIVGFLVFYAYPTLRGIYLSFTEFHVLSPPKWIGLGNFQELFGDSVFWHSLLVTIYFVALSVVFRLIFSLVTAVVLHRLTRSTVLRGLVLLPFLISGVVAALTWSWMLDSQLGIVNIVLTRLFGGHGIEFLGSGSWAVPSLAMINVWAGSKNPDLAWKWVSYMGSPACQTTAGASGTFFPSIPASMDASATAMAKQGVDLSVFLGEQKNNELFTAPDYANGAAVQSALQPLFEAYWAHQRNDDVFKDMQTQSQQLLTKS